jgi:hypothetical protein
VLEAVLIFWQIKNRRYGKGQTAYNSVYLLAAKAAGLQKTAVGLAPFMRFSSATFFCVRETACAVSFIGRKKTSDTRGTLCAIYPKIGLKL